MNSLCTTPWESKNYQPGLDVGLWYFSFFSQGDVSPTHSGLCRFVKKNFVCIRHHDNVLVRRDSIFPLLRCQIVWSKTCTQLSLSQLLFQNLKNCSFGNVKKFCYHSWCDLTVIFDQISNSSNVYLQFESILDGLLSHHLLPASFHLKIENTTKKRLIGSEPHSHKPFPPILVFLLQINKFWNKVLWKLSVYLYHPWCIKKTDFTRQDITRTLSKINKRKSVCEWKLVDITYLVSWPIDRSSSVI